MRSPRLPGLLLLFPALLLLACGCEFRRAPDHDADGGLADSFLVGQPPGMSRTWAATEIWLSLAVLAFGLIVLGLQTAAIFRLRDGATWTPTDVLRFHTLTLIITGSLMLIVAGYSNEQTAAVFGLLGSIAGYVLGSADRPKPNPDPT